MLGILILVANILDNISYICFQFFNHTENSLTANQLEEIKSEIRSVYTIIADDPVD